MNKYLKKMTLTFMLMLSAFTGFASANSDREEIVLTNDNTLILDQPIYDETVSVVMQKAQQLDAKLKSGEPLYLVLYTPGGSIQAGLEMITMLKGLNRPVNTITLFAASMGFQTVQGLGKRYITPFGTLMAHKAKGAFSGEFPGQIDSRYVYYLKRLEELDKIVASRSSGKLTVKSFQALYENEYWVDGFDAVQVGLADKVASIKCDHSLNGTREQIMTFWGFTIKVVYSNCPNIMGPLDVVVMIHTNQGLIPLTEFLAKGGSLTKKEERRYWGSDDEKKTATSTTPIPEVTTEGLTMEKINLEVEKVRAARSKKPVVIKDYTNKPVPVND